MHERIDNNPRAIRKALSVMPPGSKYVMESSSVWYATYRLMTDKLHLDVTLSNPYRSDPAGMREVVIPDRSYTMTVACGIHHYS